MKNKSTSYTYEEAQTAMAFLADFTNQLKVLEAKDSASINKIREKSQETVQELREGIEENNAILTAYAEEHGNEWPKSKLELTCGTLSWKTSPAKVQLPEGKTEDDIVELLEAKFPNYIFQRSMIDRRGILDSADTPEGKKMLKATGITVVKDEKLTIKPKTETLQPV